MSRGDATRRLVPRPGTGTGNGNLESGSGSRLNSSGSSNSDNGSRGRWHEFGSPVPAATNTGTGASTATSGSNSQQASLLSGSSDYPRYIPTPADIATLHRFLASARRREQERGTATGSSAAGTAVHVNRGAPTGNGNDDVVDPGADSEESDGSDQQQQQPDNNNVDASERCFEPEDAITMLDRGDRLYATRFASPSTSLLTYPFFAQVLQQMRNAASGKSGSPRLVIRAAHDTVISPVLSSLGLKQRPFAWPGYAARVGFELWRLPVEAAHSSTGSLSNVIPDHGTGSTPLAGSSSDSPRHTGNSDGDSNSGDVELQPEDSFAVRILYNGRDITGQTICGSTASASGQPEDSEGAQDEGRLQATNADNTGRELNDPHPHIASGTSHGYAGCTLARFGRFVGSLIAPHSSWEDACVVRALAS